ncbi:MAG TPA: hypothetical protein VFI00_04615, partial [Kribbella sp.]|nr:hypothetical protein [Kribbella sp.]
MRERAIRYAVNGWPVAPLAVPSSLDPHLAGETMSTASEIEAVWNEYPWEIALMAHHFEVMELPPEYG